LLALDLARIKRDLELVPAIRSVQVERALPDTLNLVIVERKPVAKVIVPRPRGDDSNPFMTILLDAQGYVMLPVELRHRGAAPAQSDDNLPSISGLNPAQLVPGRQVESGQVRAALELLREFEMSDMVGLVDVVRINVSSPAILHVSTGQGNEITFGNENLPRQLRRWREIHERAQQFNKSIATLDLSVPNNIPVTLSEGPPRVPSRTGSTDDSNHRKRNV
jgi:cell division septal protein FtsQ